MFISPVPAPTRRDGMMVQDALMTAPNSFITAAVCIFCKVQVPCHVHAHCSKAV